MPSKNHSWLQLLIGAVLLRHYGKVYTILTEATFKVNDVDTVADVCIYPKLQFDWLRDEVHLTELPLVAIEIVSLRQATQDVVDKILQLLKAGVPSCWLVQPALQTITLFVNGAKPQTFTAGVMTDPTCNVQINLDEIYS